MLNLLLALFNFHVCSCEPLQAVYKDSACTNCEHTHTAKLRSVFNRIQLKYMDMGRDLLPNVPEDLKDYGQLHFMTLLRDPFERLVSFFFFLRPTCSFGEDDESIKQAERSQLPISWLLRTKGKYAICAGDFEAYLRVAEETEAVAVC